jgi:hypothetical protein
MNVLSLNTYGAGAEAAEDPIIGLNFTSSTLFRDSNFTPPDTMGAVGPDHIVELINGRYTVYRKSDGVLLQTSSLNQFWTNAGVSFRPPFTFDPRILYDSFSRRWFAASADGAFGDNSFLVAVSKSSDPTEGWLGFAIDSDSTDLRWADFPTLGLNRDGVYLSANMFPIPGRPGDFRITFVSIPKDDLLAATTAGAIEIELGTTDGNTALPQIARSEDEAVPQESVPDIVTPSALRAGAPAPDIGAFAVTSEGVRATKFENISSGTTGFSVQPVVDVDNGGLPAAFLSNFATFNGQFKHSNIIGDITAPELDAGAADIFVDPFSSQFSAEQPGPLQNLEIANGTIFHANVVLQNGAFWGVQTVDNDGRAALRWFQVDSETNVVIQEGLIADDALEFYYGSIAVNDLEDVVIGFSGSGESQFVSSYAVIGNTIAGVTSFDAPLLLKDGVSDYEVTFGTGRNRWGDYSATVVDPSDPFTFWTLQEFVSAEDIWSTQITQLVVVVPQVVNDLVAFDVIDSSFETDTDTMGCPLESRGTFSFTATLFNKSMNAISDTLIEVVELSNGNLLLTDVGVLEAGARFPVQGIVDVIGPSEPIDVLFKVCLQTLEPFKFLVNALGVVE